MLIYFNPELLSNLFMTLQLICCHIVIDCLLMFAEPVIWVPSICIRTGEAFAG